jgi:hypothetical protein
LAFIEKQSFGRGAFSHNTKHMDWINCLMEFDERINAMRNRLCMAIDYDDAVKTLKRKHGISASTVGIHDNDSLLDTLLTMGASGEAILESICEDQCKTKQLTLREHEYDKYMQTRREKLKRKREGLSSQDMLTFVKNMVCFEDDHIKFNEQFESKLRPYLNKFLELEDAKRYFFLKTKWYDKIKNKTSIDDIIDFVKYMDDVNDLVSCLIVYQLHANGEIEESKQKTDNKSPEDKNPNENSSGECSVCMNSKADHIVSMKCRHMCLCKSCAELVNKCPLCNQVKDGAHRIFMS